MIQSEQMEQKPHFAKGLQRVKLVLTGLGRHPTFVLPQCLHLAI